MLRATVSRTERTSPSFVTLTLQGSDLADFDPMGADQPCRLFFRRDGQRELAMPTASHNGWLAQFMLMRPAVRPWVRLYTVRAFRPGACEMDIEFVLHGDHGDHGDQGDHADDGDHGDEGPASAFALRARPGDPVRRRHRPLAPRDDHTAVPGQLALKAVTSSWKLPPDQRVYCWVAGESDLPTGLRRHLMKEQGVPKSDISFLGYWKHGKSSHG